MASTSVFSSYPPFPSDVLTAPLSRISLSKLLLGDTDEEKALFQASRTAGFFLLDLSRSKLGEALIQRCRPCPANHQESYGSTPRSKKNLIMLHFLAGSSVTRHSVT